MRFHVFRIRVERQPQLDLLDDQTDEAQEIIEAALRSMPALVMARNHHWRIGKLETLGSLGLYFQLGRITSTTEHQWDDNTMAFVENEHETARWTPAVLDLSLQVVGIGQNTTIGPRASLGRKLRDLLNNTSEARDGRVRFAVKEIVDPDGFLQQVIAAYAVFKFTFTALKPNFPDSTAMTRAMEHWIRDLDGQEGKAEVKGVSLDQVRIEEQARETVARGGRVSARIRKTESSPVQTIHGGKVAVTVDGEYDTDEGKRTTLERIRAKFFQIRGRE